jgi:hypothetical protein
MDCPKKDCIYYYKEGYTHRNCINCGSDFLDYETENSFSKRTEQEANKKFEKSCIDIGININDLFCKSLNDNEKYALMQNLSKVKKFIHFCVMSYLEDYETKEGEDTYIEYLDIVMSIIEKEQFRLGIGEAGE